MVHVCDKSSATDTLGSGFCQCSHSSSAWFSHLHSLSCVDFRLTPFTIAKRAMSRCPCMTTSRAGESFPSHQKWSPSLLSEWRDLGFTWLNYESLESCLPRRGFTLCSRNFLARKITLYSIMPLMTDYSMAPFKALFCSFRLQAYFLGQLMT